MAAKAGGLAEQVGDSTALEMVARAGLVAYGLVHLLIAWLALKIAWSGSAGHSVDTSGAMATIAVQPFGKILLWLIALGLVALALWQVSEAIWGHRYRRGVAKVREKATSAALILVYATLGASAAQVALGSRSSSSQSEQQATSGVLALPGGRVIVVAAGLVIIGIGIASMIAGVRKSFREQIDTTLMSSATRVAVMRLGQFGYITKGVALAVVGALLTYATLSFQPRKSQGLDGAMQTILAQPFGKFLLTAVALGFVAFGLFAMLQSRYRRM
jgi:NADH:ubiquinone oxidoreductase subunit D